MPTPFAPSLIWQRKVDPPIKQDASYKMTSQDRGYIDSQIIGLETLLLAVIGTGLVGFGSADQFYVTNHAGLAAQWQTVAGDVSYASGIMTVNGVRGISVPAPSGTNTVLTYNGGAYSWTNITSGLSAFGADLAGSTSINQWVASISGPGGVGSSLLPVHTIGFQFDQTQTNPTIGQATRTSDATVYNMILAPQGPWAGAASNTTPGSLVVQLASPVGSGNHATLAVTEGGSNVAQLGQFLWPFGSVPAWALWLGPVAATTHNASLVRVSGGGGTGLYDPTGIGIIAANPDFTTPTTAITADPIEGVLLYSQNAVANPAPGPSFNIRDTFSVLATLEAGATVPLLGVGEFSTSRRYTFLNQITGSLHGPVSANIPSGDGVTWVGNAQVNPSSAPTGGFLLYADHTTGAAFIYNPGAGSAFQIGTGGGSFTPGGDLTGNSSTQYVQSISGASALGGAVPVGTVSHNVTLQFPNLTTQAIIEAGSQYLIANDGSNNLQLNGIASVQIQTGSTPLATFNGPTQPGLFPDASLSGFMFGWYSNTTASTQGAFLYLQPQFSTNANASGGYALMQLQAPSGSGVEAYFVVQRCATYNGVFTNLMQFGAAPISGNPGAIYGPGTVPGANNYSVLFNSTSTTISGATGAGTVSLAVNAVSVLNVSASSVTFAQPVGGAGTSPFQWQIATQSVNGSSGTFTLLPGVYTCPIIKLTSTSSPGSATVIFPNVEAEWIIDTSGMTWGGGNVVVKAGSGTKVISLTSVSQPIHRIFCDGNSSIYTLLYS